MCSLCDFKLQSIICNKTAKKLSSIKNSRNVLILYAIRSLYGITVYVYKDKCIFNAVLNLFSTCEGRGLRMDGPSVKHGHDLTYKFFGKEIGIRQNL